ncbi:MAG: pyridoxamine 5'-phosphate oxidase family protein [Trebonia sp.]
MIFTRAVLDYLATQHIGRLATVSPDGQVQNNPTNLVVDADAGTIVIGGARSAGQRSSGTSSGQHGRVRRGRPGDGRPMGAPGASRSEAPRWR